MIKVVPYWQSHPVEYLVRMRFPTARFEDSVLPYPDNDPERRRNQQAAEEYQKELEQLGHEEIQQQIADQRKMEDQAAREWAEKEEAARPFNRPEAKADFAYWASMSYWTIDEAVALSLGRNPKSAEWPYVKTLVKISPFAAKFSAKREVAMRAKAMGQLWDSTIPAIFLAWAERMKFEVPRELLDAVRGMGFQIADWKTLYDKQVAENQVLRDSISEVQEAHLASEKAHGDKMAQVKEDQKFHMSTAQSVIEKRDTIIAERGERIDALSAQLEEREAKPLKSDTKSASTRERDSLLKLVIAMAMDGYGYDPKAARSPIAKEIADQLALAGLRLDEDTVRKYLNEAKQLLPGDDAE